MGGNCDWFLRCIGFSACEGGAANIRASTPFVPGAGIVEKGTETSSRELDKANNPVGKEPDAAMQQGGNPVVEPAESGSGSAHQSQPESQQAAPRAVKTLLDGDLRVYLDEVGICCDGCQISALAHHAFTPSLPSPAFPAQSSTSP